MKVYNAYKRATEHKGGPTLILAKTVKGYGLGSEFEARNPTHQNKKLSEETIVHFRKRFEIPIPDEAARDGALYRPPDSSPEVAYMHERRRVLGGYLPVRNPGQPQFQAPGPEIIDEFRSGSKEPHPSSTMAFVRLLGKLMKLPEIGKKIVPIVPDEARTFGMESMFRTYGIYASGGQLYKPHDSEILLYYKEAKDGQVLEEGITEAGSMAEFAAAGTAYANYGVDTIPFYIYYSMFGFQRVGDQIWAFADSRGKGFLLGGTAGRTTLNGEGLQHQDGHSLLLASTVPTLSAYDPCYAYEIAVIVRDGIRRMYENREDLFYYLTLYNENYEQAAMPEGCEEGILKGIYLLQEVRRGEAESTSATSGQWPDPDGSAAGAEDSRRKIPRRRGSLERHQLQRTAPRGVEDRSLEPAASGRTGEGPVRPGSAGRHGGPDHCRIRLHESGAGSDRAMAAGAFSGAGHGRIRTQRKPGLSATAFRGERGFDRRSGSLETGARR